MTDVDDQVRAIMAADAAQQATAPQPPQTIEPAPTPWSIAVGKGEVNGAPTIVIQVHKVTGTDVLFCPPEFARTVAAMLTEAASGLTLPPAGLVLP